MIDDAASLERATTGFVATLTDEQKKLAREYTGDERHGDARHIKHPDRSGDQTSQLAEKQAVRVPEVTDAMVIAALNATDPDWDDEFSRAKARSNARNHMRKILKAALPAALNATSLMEGKVDG